MNISRNSQKPPFAVLAENLRRRIEERALKPGAMIGTEVNLAAESGLSRMTVRRRATISQSRLEARILPVKVRPNITPLANGRRILFSPE